MHSYFSCIDTYHLESKRKSKRPHFNRSLSGTSISTLLPSLFHAQAPHTESPCNLLAKSNHQRRQRRQIEDIGDLGCCQAHFRCDVTHHRWKGRWNGERYRSHLQLRPLKHHMPPHTTTRSLEPEHSPENQRDTQKLEKYAHFHIPSSLFYSEFPLSVTRNSRTIPLALSNFSSHLSRLEIECGCHDKCAKSNRLINV